MSGLFMAGLRIEGQPHDFPVSGDVGPLYHASLPWAGPVSTSGCRFSSVTVASMSAKLSVFLRSIDFDCRARPSRRRSPHAPHTARRWAWGYGRPGWPPTCRSAMCAPMDSLLLDLRIYIFSRDVIKALSAELCNERSVTAWARGLETNRHPSSIMTKPSFGLAVPTQGVECVMADWWSGYPLQFSLEQRSWGPLYSGCRSRAQMIGVLASGLKRRFEWVGGAGNIDGRSQSRRTCPRPRSTRCRTGKQVTVPFSRGATSKPATISRNATPSSVPSRSARIGSCRSVTASHVPLSGT